MVDGKGFLVVFLGCSCMRMRRGEDQNSVDVLGGIRYRVGQVRDISLGMV